MIIRNCPSPTNFPTRTARCQLFAAMAWGRRVSNVTCIVASCHPGFRCGQCASYCLILSHLHVASHVTGSKGFQTWWCKIEKHTWLFIDYIFIYTHVYLYLICRIIYIYIYHIYLVNMYITHVVNSYVTQVTIETFAMVMVVLPLVK